MNENTASTKPKRRKNFQEMWGWLFAGPAILGFLVFTAGPMLMSLYLSFTDSTLGITGNWVGIHHYREIFTVDPFITICLRVTFTYVVMAVPINLITAFGMALLLNTEGLKGKKFYRTIAYMPYVVPAVATAFLWRWLFNPSMGLMNTILEAVGLPPSQWIFSERTVLPSIAMMVIWSIGANMIIYLAGLQGVPRSLYDAIEVDGGGIFSKFRYATLPMMTPTIFFTLIMGIIHNLQAFFQAFIMTEGGPNNGSLFFAYHIYRTGFVSNNMSRASALSWVLFVIVMFFTAFIFLSSKKWVYYEGGDNQ